MTRTKKIEMQHARRTLKTSKGVEKVGCETSDLLGVIVSAQPRCSAQAEAHLGDDDTSCS